MLVAALPGSAALSVPWSWTESFRLSTNSTGGQDARRHEVTSAKIDLEAGNGTKSGVTESQGIDWKLLCAEPFRLFFPLAVVVGLIGVALWPLHFAGFVEFYPGQSHARVMAYGFFTGFFMGFLGTALPRMLGSASFRPFEIGLLLALYLATVFCTLENKFEWGDTLFLLLLGAFCLVLFQRIWSRRDVPPPSFILVGLAMLCGLSGATLSLWVSRTEDAFFAATLQHLLAYQGYILLPILGVGAFLLPRFFDLPNRQEFAESRTPPPGWTRQFAIALAAGALIIGSFWLEATGWARGGPALRLVISAVYLAREVPIYRGSQGPNSAALMLRLGFLCVLLGFLAMVIYPGYRIAVLHLTLVGGFAVITLVVATRVIFGHSGNGRLLKLRSRWLTIAVSLMMLGMITRVTGDFLPEGLTSHYSYGAALWIVAVLLWSVYVLPKVLRPDPED